MHGHNYVCMFFAVADGLDDIGRVIDFSVLKEKLGGWIDKHWDHTYIVYKADHEVIAALESVSRKKPYFVADFNPTAENMAEYLLKVVCPKELDGTGVKIKRVQLWETENCFVNAEI